MQKADAYMVLKDALPNLVDDSIDIEYCAAESRATAMHFIDEHWRKGHIMATDAELFDFLHKRADGKYDFLLARKGDEVIGILGMVRVLRYDCSVCDDADIWLAIWKNIGDLGAGVSLLLKACEGQRTVGAIGINDKVARLYAFLGFKVVELSHYYMLNYALSNYEIAYVPMGRDNPHSGGRQVFISRLTVDELYGLQIESNYRPRKTCGYLIGRYARHPIYSYTFWGVSDVEGGPVGSVFVMRKINIVERACLRIVDWIGEFPQDGSLVDALQRIMKADNAEYIDCLNYGIDAAAFEHLGFTSLRGADTVIIPQYFEPFERRNVTIKAAILNTTDDNYVIFKGDSDQDRPNRRP